MKNILLTKYFVNLGSLRQEYFFSILFSMNKAIKSWY